MRAVEDTIKTVCPKEGVRCVSFKQLADWLDVQDPKALDRLRKLDVAEAPKGGWERYLADAPARPGKPSSQPSVQSSAGASSPGSAAPGSAAPGSAAPVKQAAE
jgi:hypothetical protein